MGELGDSDVRTRLSRFVGIVVAVGEELLALGVAAGGKLEADLVGRVRRVVDSPVGVVAGIVAGAAVAGDNLDILVAVVLLLLGEADGGVDLAAHVIEVGSISAGGADEAIGADGGGFLGVVVAVVDEDVAAEGAAGLHLTGGRRVADIHVLGAVHARGVIAAAVEIDEVGDALAHFGSTEAGAGGKGEVFGGQIETTLVSNLEAVGARGVVVLVLVCIGARSGSGHGDLLDGLADAEGEGAVDSGVVLPGVGAEVHGAVEHRLGVGAFATGDDEGVFRAYARGHRPRRLGPYPAGGEEGKKRNQYSFSVHVIIYYFSDAKIANSFKIDFPLVENSTRGNIFLIRDKKMGIFSN